MKDTVLHTWGGVHSYTKCEVTMQDYITKILQNIFLKAQQEPTRSYRMLRVSIGDTLSNWKKKENGRLKKRHQPACLVYCIQEESRGLERCEPRD